MNSIHDFTNGNIQVLTNHLKLLKTLNPQWEDSSVAESFIHFTNDAAEKQFNNRQSFNKQSFANFPNEKEYTASKNTNIYDAIEPKTNILEKHGSERSKYFPEYPFEIEINTELGRHLISKRDLAAGEVLLMEGPLIVGPIVREPFEKSMPYCVHCFKVSNTYICPECGFFLCRGICKNVHVNNDECSILAKLGLVKEQQHIQSMENRNFAEMVSGLAEEERPDSLLMIAKTYISFIQEERYRVMKYYPALPTLRTLCQISKKRTMAQLISSLYGTVDPASKRYKINQNTIVNTILKLLPNYDQAFIHRIADIWDTNAFEVKVPQRTVQALYSIASLMTHSCKPNCEHNFALNGTMVLRTVDIIPKGTILTLSYSDKIWPTYIRRNHLQLTKKFLCNCDRCLDPTECGTYTGHVKCEDCGHLSISVLQGEDTCALIRCSHCNCNIDTKEFFKTEAGACNIFGNCSVKTLQEFEDAIATIEDIFKGRYHKNHHLIQRLRIDFLLENNQTNYSALATKDLETMESIARDTYLCSSVLSRLSQQKARIAREWIRLRKELFSRKGQSLANDEEFKATIEDAKLALHWEQRLPQV